MNRFFTSSSIKLAIKFKKIVLIKMIMRKKLYLIRNKLDLMKDFYKKNHKNLSLKCTNLMELINTPSNK